MEAPELNADFIDFLECLIAGNVRFVVVGAHALAAHGLPRATGALDVLIEPTPINASAVVGALEAFGAPMKAHGVNREDFAKEGTVYQMGLPPRRIDLLTSVSGVSFERVWTGRIVAQVQGMPLPFIGCTQLIEDKLASGRPKDLLDVAALRSQADE
ncbi:MAG: hypothetical protein SF187_11860 [Deltaproteobacteria bacterium]|nr:hypothetical protein [Deltaproteobacteria bacterium]